MIDGKDRDVGMTTKPNQGIARSTTQQRRPVSARTGRISVRTARLYMGSRSDDARRAPAERPRRKFREGHRFSSHEPKKAILAEARTSARAHGRIAVRTPRSEAAEGADDGIAAGLATMIMDDRELEALIREGETFGVEFKETLKGDAPKTAREAVCAFANDLPNSGRPGVLFVGVADDGRLTGNLRVTDELLLQLADIKNDGQIVPPPSMLVERRRILGNEVAVVIVTPSDSPPVRYRGNIHIRIGPRRGIATAQDERILNERRRSLDAPFDIQPVPGADIASLDRRRFDEDYLPGALSREALEANDRSLNQRLAAAKMTVSVDDTTPTVVGLLALGHRPRDHLSTAWMQFLRIRGTELSDDISDAEEIDGDLTTMLRRIDDRLRSHIRTPVDLTTSDTESRLPSYPMVALQQIVRNAIMHRTYEGTNAPVRITWFDDRIEVVSPGGPFGAAAAGGFGRPGVTDYRNPNLSEALKVLGFVQRFGVGIASARTALREGGHPDPEFETDDGFVAAIIRGRPG